MRCKLNATRLKQNSSQLMRLANIFLIEQKVYNHNGLSYFCMFKQKPIGFYRQSMATKQSIIALFLSQFTLSEAETEAITSRDVPVGKRMFEAMDRIEKIRDSCQILLAGEGASDTVGCVALSLLYIIADYVKSLDIMALTSSLLEQAYQKIFRWCSFEFRQLGKDAQLDVGSVMKETVRQLKNQPDLLV